MLNVSTHKGRAQYDIHVRINLPNKHCNQDDLMLFIIFNNNNNNNIDKNNNNHLRYFISSVGLTLFRFLFENYVLPSVLPSLFLSLSHSLPLSLFKIFHNSISMVAFDKTFILNKGCNINGISKTHHTDNIWGFICHRCFHTYCLHDCCALHVHTVIAAHGV